jgi:hypothetical protein
MEVKVIIETAYHPALFSNAQKYAIKQFLIDKKRRISVSKCHQILNP